MKKTPKKILSLILLLAMTGCTNSNSSLESTSSLANSNQTSSVAPKAYEGEGRPNDAFGNDGDTYTDTSTGNVYLKENGHWVLVEGNEQQQLSGVGAPSNDLGNNGDTYTDTSNGNIYVKQNGQWILISEGEKTEEHTVVFDLNGGQMPDGSISIPSQTVKNGGWVKKPSQDPIKQNSNFLGWYPDGEGSKWSFTTPVYGDLTLVAKYSVNEEQRVILNVDPNNGDEVYTVETFAGDIPRIETPSKDGYNFIGWYYQDNNTEFNGIVGDNDNGRTIVAKFEKSKFNLTYQVEQDNTVTITGLLDINSVSVIIPSSIDGYEVAGIGEKAFQNRIKLVDVTIPSTVKNIHPKAFTGARMLSAVNVDSSSSYFTSIDGVLYTKDMKEIRLCPPKNCTSFTLPDSIEKIGAYAFYGHKESGVSTIKFNEGLVEIGERAFYENTGIKTLRFPSSLRVIGTGAFNCVTASGTIQDVKFNDGLEIIGDSAFVGAYFKDALKLPSSVKEIGAYAFANCTAITSFEFPKSLETLGDNPFAGATGILSITIEQGNTRFTVKDNILYTSDMKKVVMCPSGRVDKVVIDEGVEEIGDFAFYMVDNAQEYEFPSTLTKIGKQAFAHCYGLRNFTIPDTVTSIGDNCFDLCESLTSLTIGSGLEVIPKQAFIECYSLKNLEIPSTVKRIGQEAFFGCAGIKELTLNEGLETIDKAAFCFSTTEYNSNVAASITTLSLPDSLITLGDRAFANQGALTSVEIGKELEYFGVGAFEGAPISILAIDNENENFASENKILYNKDKTYLYFALTSLSGSVSLPNGVKTIGSYAFDNCEKVTGITFPNTLEKIEEGAFYSTNITNIEFPSSLKEICDGAFYLGSLKTVKFNEGLEKIGISAFNANDIEALKLPNSLKEIGETAFSGLWKLTSLEFGNGLVSIGERAFQRCTKLTGEITLPATIENLGVGLFVNNTLITNIKFSGEGNYVSENGVIMDKDKQAVYGYAPAYNSTSLTLPQSVKEIKNYGLFGASKLTSLTLPNTLETIGECGLGNIIKVAHLVIPASVTYIGKNAFANAGDSINQKISFECSQDYALMHYDPLFLGEIKSKLTVEYNYKG